MLITLKSIFIFGAISIISHFFYTFSFTKSICSNMSVKRSVSVSIVKPGTKRAIICRNDNQVAFSPVNCIQGEGRIVSREIQYNAKANKKAIRQIRALQENRIITPR
jgi:hypothetical protein